MIIDDVLLLIAQLPNEDSGINLTSAQLLGKLGDERAVQPLIATLKYECTRRTYSGIEGYVATALARIGDSAVAPLIVALPDEHAQFRLFVAWTLGAIRDGRAVDPLLAMLTDKDTQVRRTVIWALGKIADKRAVVPLMTIFQDENAWIRQSVATALGEIGDTRALEPLLATLHDEKPYVRSQVAKALGKLGDTQAVDALVTALEDNSAKVRYDTAKALGKLGDERAVQPLIPLLQDYAEVAFEQVNHSAINALEKIGTSEAIQAIQKAKEEGWLWWL